MKKRMFSCIMIFLIFILMIMLNQSNCFANQNGQITGTTYEANASGELKGQGTIYCVEQGVYFYESCVFNVTDAFNVQDPILAYIINMPDADRNNWGWKDAKQNMIWWYMKNNSSSREANIIKSYSGLWGAYKSEWPAARTLNEADIEGYINDAKAYAEKTNNVNLKISSTKIENNKLKVEVSTKNIDNVYAYANDNKMTCISKSDSKSFYEIELSNLSTNGYVTIKVDGKNNVKKASFQVLYRDNSQVQTLINVINGGTEEKLFASDSVTIAINTNVSLQKYITKVNNIELKNTNTSLTDLTDRKNTYSEVSGTTEVSYSERSNMKTNKYKQENVVSIEAGDYVTYRIYVYNNSAVNASNVKITDTLPTLNGRYSINGETYKQITSKTIDYTIKNLVANSSQYFDVTVQFWGYENGRLDNIAEITGMKPNNETTYRTKDADYVKMKQYEVSLEKYISKIESSGISGNQMDLSKYQDMIEYIIKNKTEDKDVGSLIDELINKLSENQVNENFRIYDLNGDEKVDSRDIEINNRIKNVNNKDIEAYIKADLNNDGKVDNTDITLYNKYIEYKADLNNDGVLNKLDKYAFIMKHLNDKNILNSDTLTNFYIFRLLQNNTKDNIISKIEEYMKSDVDDNGVVNENDSKYQKYDLTNQNINEITNEKISVIQKIIEIFDINEDGLLNQDDIKIYNLYKLNKPKDLIEFKKNMLEETSIVNSDSRYDSSYDIDGDGKISFEDYLTFMTYINEEELDKEITENTPDEVKIAKNIKKLLDYDLSSFDLNNDNKVDIEDYKLLNYFIEIKEYEKTGSTTIESILENDILSKAIENYNVVDENPEEPNLSIKDIIAINLYKGFKEFDENLKISEYQQYDINNDGLINNTDKQMIQNYENETLINIIDKSNISDDLFNNILVNDYEEFAVYFEKVLGNTIDISAIDTNVYSYDELSAIIQTDDKKVENIEIDGTKTLSLTDIENAIAKDISDLDINGDGIVNEVDMVGYDNRENLTELNTALIQRNDIDGDGDWDNTDNNILKQVQILKGKSQAEIDNIKETIRLLANKGVETTEARKGYAEHNYDNNLNTNNNTKYNNVAIASKGDFITYTIIVNNDSNDTSVYIHTIEDYLPNGVKYNNVEYKGNKYCTKFEDIIKDNVVTFNNLSGILLKPGESTSFTVTVEVIENNISLNILKNTAKITQIKNKNGITMNADEADSTPNNNQDSDYFQMKDIAISGTVWNDVAWDKAQKDYNGTYENEEGKDKPLNSSINVYLYRNGISAPIATTYTIINEENKELNGTYSFALNYIKGPKATGTNRWEGTYYSYYVVFEYDGVTYTSTKFADITSDNPLDSNAKEDNGKTSKIRTSFNNQFNVINNASNIKYDTKNEEGYIPQSIHNPYDANGNLLSKYKMQSSTNLITLSNNEALEQQLIHVNLGLRGRDTFDLKLITDVYSTKIEVNGVPGVYQYNNNRVTLRKSDIGVVEDTANITNEQITSSVTELDQEVRKTDIKNEKYSSTGLKIEVTYKITVQNVSSTDGTATKITDYYDDKYTFVKAYGDNNQTLSTSNSTAGTGYKSVIITTPSTNLTAIGDGTSTMNIYLVFNLTNAEDILKQFLVDGKTNLPTFNIAEITEYKTQCAKGQSEYTRGLLDINSVPGSSNKEQARLITTEGQNTPTVDGNPTTVKYYFEKARAYLNDRESRELNNLKYEDDTAAAPILYFTSSDNQRTITGTVFEDKTTTNPTTRIKTGDGVQKGEVGVYGATVELVEISSNKNPQDIAENEGTVRDTKQTDKDGKFTISGFLPGYYVIRYRYGDTTDTVLLHQGGENINKQSYNGEDYQSTNNTGTYGANKLSERANYWYLDNESEGISTATDNSIRRTEVSDKVTGFTDEEMTVLNNMRDMVGTYNKNTGELVANEKYNDNKTLLLEIAETKVSGIGKVIEDTKMYSTTKQMYFTVEKSFIENNELKEVATFADYTITNMNFGIAEVPVTTIDLQKTVQAFNLTDSTGNNTIASVVKNDSGKWELKGDVIAPEGATSIDVSVEDEKLQGARLQVTYAITSKIYTEKNFDNKTLTVPTIKGIVDYIDNNLSYNPALGENSKYWEVTTYEEIKSTYALMQYKGGTIPKGTVDAEGNKYTTIVKAKSDSPLLLTTAGEGTATITLEKILSSTDSTIEEIITSTVDTYAYNNIVEITGINYNNVTPTDPDSSKPESDLQRDRVRTPDRYIILPGVQHDSKIAETITIHPPTGDSSINIMYYVIAAVSLIILAVGVFGIKKFVLKK